MAGFPPPAIDAFARLTGALLGCAVGDALGLPAEGMTPARQKALWPGPWRHRFIAGRGLWSDDTEHTFFVAQSLLAHPTDVRAFRARLAWCLRGWLLGLPAGVGLATLLATVRLCLGISPERSGVFSAGNGPAMRSAVLGAFFAADPERLSDYVRASTRLTHTDPKAEIAALAVAHLAAESLPPQTTLAQLRSLADDPVWLKWIAEAESHLATQRPVREFAASLGLSRGVTGYAWHTVPVAVYACLRHPESFRGALVSVLECGGDTDTTGAIVGGIMGARLGAAAIPGEWIAGVCEWPRTMDHLRTIGARLAAIIKGGSPAQPVRYFWPGMALRNAAFLVLVLLHGLRRLLPPY